MAALLGKLKDEYEGALLHNTGTLVAVESTLRQLTWFLPGRFSDSEVASEGSEWHNTRLEPTIADMHVLLSQSILVYRYSPSTTTPFCRRA